MLEVFYRKDTKVVTAWRGKGRQGTRPLREGEDKALLNISIPSELYAYATDYLYDEDAKNLKLRPDFKPPIVRDTNTEIDAIKARLNKLEGEKKI